MGPVKWSYFCLYVIPDIFSRRVGGWRVEHAECATLFKAVFSDAMGKHAVTLEQLTLHADRGGTMRAAATALMLACLGVVKSHRGTRQCAAPVGSLIFRSGLNCLFPEQVEKGFGYAAVR